MDPLQRTQGRKHRSAQGLHCGKMSVGAKEVALGLFIECMGSVVLLSHVPFSRICDGEGRFLFRLLTVVCLVRMQCGWQHKLGCSIWLP